MDHVTARALALAEEKVRARLSVPGRLGVESGLVERTQPSCQLLKIVVGQVEGRHAARGAAFDQIANLRFGHGAQCDIVHQRRRPVTTGSALAMAPRADTIELLLCRGKTESRRLRQSR